MQEMPSFESDLEIWDYIATNLVKQGKKSADYYDDTYVNQGFSCMYRGYDPKTGDNLKCAVGWLITDENYNQGFEDESIDSNDVLMAVKLSNPNLVIGSEVFAMLKLAQYIHDQMNPEIWNRAFSVGRVLCFVDGSFADSKQNEFTKWNKLYHAIKAICDPIGENTGMFAEELFPLYKVLETAS